MIGALWGLNVLYQQQKEGASRNLVEIARGVAAVVEKEFATSEITLKTLALAPSLASGDLATFYDFAKAAAPSADRTVVLIDLGGQQRINTRLPFGSSLPRSKAFAELRAQARAEETLVSDLYFAPVGKRHSYALQVPVVRENRVVAYLAMGSYAESLQKGLEDQRLPAGWNAAVLDRKGIVVARRLRPEQLRRQFRDRRAARPVARAARRRLRDSEARRGEDLHRFHPDLGPGLDVCREHAEIGARCTHPRSAQRYGSADGRAARARAGGGDLRRSHDIAPYHASRQPRCRSRPRRDDPGPAARAHRDAHGRNRAAACERAHQGLE